MPALLLAHADGPGAGRFLARAIWDPLRGGSRLAEATVSPGPPLGILELRFSRAERDASEVVRCAVDGAGRPISVEIWLAPEPPPLGALEAAASLAVLVALSPNLVSVRFLPEGVAELADDAGNSALLPVRSVAGVPGSRPSANRW